MLDLLGILFSSIAMFLEIFRSIQPDNMEPWFRAPGANKVDDSGQRLTKGRPGEIDRSTRRAAAQTGSRPAR